MPAMPIMQESVSVQRNTFSEQALEPGTLNISRLRGLTDQAPKRPSYVHQIQECLGDIESARANGFTWDQIAAVLGISRPTLLNGIKAVHRRGAFVNRKGMSSAEAKPIRHDDSTLLKNGYRTSVPKAKKESTSSHAVESRTTENPGLIPLGRASVSRFNVTIND